MTFVKGDEAPRRGHARMVEIAAEDAGAIKTTADALIAGLGEKATAIDRADAEMLASLLIRARRARLAGRSDVALLLQYATVRHDTAFRSPHAPTPMRA
jgi:hypothetical protein